MLEELDFLHSPGTDPQHLSLDLSLANRKDDQEQPVDLSSSSDRPPSTSSSSSLLLSPPLVKQEPGGESEAFLLEMGGNNRFTANSALLQGELDKVQNLSLRNISSISDVLM